ncbi:MAG: hypothetical protein ACK4SX_09190 [Alcanivoracaceae bacterium]
MKQPFSVFFLLLMVSGLGHAISDDRPVVIANANNHAALDSEQIRRIFVGRDDRLPGIGAVSFIMRGEAWPMWPDCTQKYARMTPDALIRHWARRVFSGGGGMAGLAQTDRDAIQAVLSSPGGISCVSLASTRGVSGLRVID